MARGHPDWQLSKSSKSQLDVDTNELISRMGSPYTLIRSGKVLWQTNFSRDLNDVFIFNEAGFATWSLDNEWVLYGNKSLKIIGDGANDDRVIVRKKIPNVGINSLGVQIAILGNTPINHNVELFLRVINPRIEGEINQQSYICDVVFQLSDGSIRELNNIGGAGAHCTYHTTNEPTIALNFHVMKVVIDLISNKLDYAQLNGQICEYNENLDNVVTGNVEQIQVEVSAVTRIGGVNVDWWLDHIIITNEENILFGQK